MALNANLVWEIQPGVGASTNGGAFDAVSGTPGTDYTYGAGAQVISWKASGGTYTNDLASTQASGWLVLTSASRNFVAADVGNIINITAGTNFTSGRYQIVSVAANAATLDRACGVTADASTGTGYLGGAVDLLDTIFNKIVAGNAVWSKKNATSDSISTARATTNGSVALPVSITGYNAARGDLTDPASGGTWSATHNSAGSLDTTNFPTLALAGNLLTLGDFTKLSGFNVTGSRSGALISGATSIVFFRNHINNTSTNIAARACTVTNVRAVLNDNDLICATASGGYVATMTSGNTDGLIVNNRVTSANGGGIQMGNIYVVQGNVFYSLAASQTAIEFGTADRTYLVSGNTFFNILGTCVTLPNSAQANGRLLFQNNQVTGCGVGVNNLRSGTTRIPIYGGNNRIRNTTTPYTGFCNVTDATGYLPGDITTAQTDSAEYVASTSSPPDLRLLVPGAGRAGGLPPYTDIGAWQRQEAGPVSISSSRSGL